MLSRASMVIIPEAKGKVLTKLRRKFEIIVNILRRCRETDSGPGHGARTAVIFPGCLERGEFT